MKRPICIGKCSAKKLEMTRKPPLFGRKSMRIGKMWRCVGSTMMMSGRGKRSKMPTPRGKVGPKSDSLSRTCVLLSGASSPVPITEGYKIHTKKINKQKRAEQLLVRSRDLRMICFLALQSIHKGGNASCTSFKAITILPWEWEEHRKIMISTLNC